jgi:hypothetical protein
MFYFNCVTFPTFGIPRSCDAFYSSTPKSGAVRCLGDVPCRDGVVPCRDGAVPCHDGALPCRRGAVPCRSGTFRLSQWRLSLAVVAPVPCLGGAAPCRGVFDLATIGEGGRQEFLTEDVAK